MDETITRAYAIFLFRRTKRCVSSHNNNNNTNILCKQMTLKLLYWPSNVYLSVSRFAIVMYFNVSPYITRTALRGTEMSAPVKRVSIFSDHRCCRAAFVKTRKRRRFLRSNTVFLTKTIIYLFGRVRVVIR